jgi:predicted AAA+ superfamily ATPase
VKENFISTFIERDLLQWTGSSPLAVRRLWEMLAHVDGQTVNYSGLGNSLGISNVTVKNYIDILQSTFMVEIVSPHIINTGKRLVKSPKVYINDSGIISGLLHLKDFDRLAGHPVFGSLWEGVVLANLRGHFPGAEIRYYRTSHGAELDFVMLLDGNTFAIECKASLAPSLSRGSYTAIEDLNPKHTFVVSPVQKGYSMKKGVDVVSLSELMTKLQEFV